MMVLTATKKCPVLLKTKHHQGDPSSISLNFDSFSPVDSRFIPNSEVIENILMV